MLKLVPAILVQIIAFGIYFYIDARQTIAPDPSSVVRFGLHPPALLYVAFSVFPLGGQRLANSSRSVSEKKS